MWLQPQSQPLREAFDIAGITNHTKMHDSLESVRRTSLSICSCCLESNSQFPPNEIQNWGNIYTSLPPVVWSAWVGLWSSHFWWSNSCFFISCIRYFFLSFFFFGVTPLVSSPVGGKWEHGLVGLPFVLPFSLAPLQHRPLGLHSASGQQH